MLTQAAWAEMTLKAIRETSSSHVDIYNNVFKPSAVALAPKVFGSKVRDTIKVIVFMH